MGAVKIDIEAAANKYSACYPLQHELGVCKLFGDYYALIGAAYGRGDFAAIDLITDLATAVRRARLTKRQEEVLVLVYLRDMSDKEAAEELGGTRQMVQQYRTAAVRKITKIYTGWDYK